MPARMVVWDTDVASLTHKRRVPPALVTRLVGTYPLITFITPGESTKWAEARHWSQRSRGELARWLSTLPVLQGDEDVAITWGRLSAAAMRRGRPRPVNDTWIAACCLTHEIPLATLNVKDFKDFQTHHGLELITAY